MKSLQKITLVSFLLVLTFAGFSAAGCMVNMFSTGSGISVGISWENQWNKSFGSAANGYRVPAPSGIKVAINGSYAVHCEDGHNGAVIPPHRMIVQDITSGAVLTINLPESCGPFSWCNNGATNTQCAEAPWACDGGPLCYGIPNPTAPSYYFEKPGVYNVTLQYVSHPVDNTRTDIPEDAWITDKQFQVTVVSPLLLAHSSGDKMLPLEIGRTTSVNVVWTFQNLGEIPLKISSVESPACADNNLTCTWLADPVGIRIPPKGAIVATQQVSLSASVATASYLPRDVDFSLDFNYTDATSNELEFSKTSEKMLVKIKPIASRPVSVKVKGPGDDTCYGVENGNVKTGVTGLTAMPKILLNWNFSDISRTQCDKQDSITGIITYCDSVQFLTELLKKLERIDNINTNNLLDEPSANPATELYSLQNFEAFLIKDGYPSSLMNDYSTFLLTQPLLPNSSWFKDGKFSELFTTPSKFRIMLAQDSSSLDTAVQLNSENALTTGIEKPGLYEVYIRLPSTYYDNALRKFILNDQINTDINVYLIFKANPQNNNIFYYLPFDGKVGYNQATSRFERTGYGIQFANSAAGFSVSGVEGIPTAAGTALNSMATSKVADDFSRLNNSERGSVLKINSLTAGSFDALSYPTTATPILFRIQQGKVENSLNQASTEAGGFYYVMKDRSPENPAGTPVSPATGAMSFWNGVASNMLTTSNVCMDFTAKRLSASFFKTPDTKLSSLSQASIAECNPSAGITANNSFGFSWPNLAESSAEKYILLDSVLYALKGTNYSLSPACDNKDNLAYAMPNQGFSKNEPNPVYLNYEPKYPDETKVDVESIAGILTALQNRFLCLSTDSAKADFWWNEDKLFEQLKAMPNIRPEISTVINSPC